MRPQRIACPHASFLVSPLQRYNNSSNLASELTFLTQKNGATTRAAPRYTTLREDLFLEQFVCVVETELRHETKAGVAVELITLTHEHHVLNHRLLHINQANETECFLLRT